MPTVFNQHPVVVAPKVLPYHATPGARALNRMLLTRAVSPYLKSLPPPRLLWTYNPVVVDELALTEYATLAYHCVDDLATIPGVPPRSILTTEPRMVRAASATFASSDKLAHRLRAFGGAKVHLTRNVADFDHFKQARNPGHIPDDMLSIPEPRAIMIGALSDHKVDWALLSAVARSRPDWSFVLVGPIGEEQANKGPAFVRDLSNVHLLGHRPYEVLPDYLRGAAAGLIPYRLTDHTEAVFPLKTWEYLAAGLHVISTPLPAVAAACPPLSFAGTATAFSAALDAGSATTIESRMLAAQSSTWDSLLDEMFILLPPPRVEKLGQL